MANAHNGKQSDATRKEMLVALQYLLEKCYDEEHTSSTVELTAYAEKQDIYLDRRRANDIFDSLVEFTKSSSVLPYKVIKVAKKPRYYIQKCFFTNDEIKGIASAIDNDSRITKDEADRFVDAFLNKTCTKSQKEQVLKKIKQRGVAKKHINAPKNNMYTFLETVMNQTKMFGFRVRDYTKVKSEDFSSISRELRMAMRKKMQLEGFVYTVIRKYDTAIIYLSKPYYCAIALKTSNIEIDLDYDIHELWAPLTFTLKNCKYNSIDEWLGEYYKGKVGLQQNVKFKFWVGSDNEQLERYKASFEEYFKETMEYTLEERTIDLTRLDGTKSTIVAIDAVVNVTCNFNSFKHWYWKEGAFESVVILNPRIWNNRLLSSITRRFERRLEKYGRDLSVELNSLKFLVEENKPEQTAESAVEDKKDVVRMENRMDEIKKGN